MAIPPPSPALPELVLFTRAECPLCDDARESIRQVLRERSAAGLPTPRLREVDIDGAADPVLAAAYGERIPVVELGGEHLELVIGPRRLARLMERVLDGVPAA